MNPSFEQFDGPRLIRREELIDSLRLSRICFGGPEIENEEEILANHVPPRRGGIYAMLHQGKPVSQTVIFHDLLKIYDGVIRVGSIGGVCTHPEYRGEGLASHLLKHCAQQLVNEGACLMLISGDGPVYTRLGNVLQGKYIYFSIGPEHESQRRSSSTELTFRRATTADSLVCSQLYQAEPVHFVRQQSDFFAALKDPKSNTYIHAGPWIIERTGQAVAYLFLGIPYWATESSGIRHVAEYAGSRTALVNAIPSLISTSQLVNVTWPVAWQDAELIHFLQAYGYPERITNLDGHTLRIINFTCFMKDLRPSLRSRLDAKLTRGLRFEQSGPLLGGIGKDRYRITRSSDHLELDGAAMTLLAMGNADSQTNTFDVPASIAEVTAALFPLPSFLLGLNYH